MRADDVMGHTRPVGATGHVKVETSVPEADGDATYRPGYTRAAERILEFITEQGFGPGDRLPTAARFAEILGVSRTITQDALKTLAATGRISTQRGRGIFVADPVDVPVSSVAGFVPTDITHIMAMFEFRGVQEQAAAGLAAKRATPVELVAIDDALEAYARSLEAADPRVMADADESFHRAVARAAHNVFLLGSIATVQGLQRRVVAAAFGGFSGGPVATALAEHRQIFEAVRRGDAEQAGIAALAHVERTRVSYEAEIDRRVFRSS
ncbi:DNA-binding FadR family transcriptional regulator [Saccharothrix ecbatanensis]|uniref:DNA-binding FadR family transcriptional regulator n=1 Tax=Saccharothrix ecbatanensis TaxID=1105145 RepID=A0A7W9HJP3_9PSEU|nr:FCD domain-containing protein [Saccharothrix ecbatanensis]MBB5803522.1 DNA-binding FadR family transcriptional regulator [Saccharothrix ecbatanensis]